MIWPLMYVALGLNAVADRLPGKDEQTAYDMGILHCTFSSRSKGLGSFLLDLIREPHFSKLFIVLQSSFC